MVTVKVCNGLIFGSTAKTVSPTRPREVESTPESFTAIFSGFAPTRMNQFSINMLNENSHLNNNLSKAVTNAQALGAQYA